MSSTELKTRDGKVVSDIGSWEREQLNKMYPRNITIEPSAKKKHDPKLKFLSRPLNTKKERLCWEVKISVNNISYKGQKKFHDKNYDNDMEKSKQAAIEYRDAQLIKWQLRPIEK